ncbi:hypothetical protein MP638_000130 [Amoeboaphelidium occidentale]|nr:hypothetical protein MP638_000130 [Amoeboaphelidium occidentale]
MSGSREAERRRIPPVTVKYCASITIYAVISLVVYMTMIAQLDLSQPHQNSVGNKLRSPLYGSSSGNHDRQNHNRPAAGQINTSRFVSTLDCRNWENLFYVENLFIIDGSFHVYLGPDAIVPPECWLTYSSFGIGSGGKSAVLDLSQFDTPDSVYNYSASFNNEYTYGYHQNPVPAFRDAASDPNLVPIHIHRSLPPKLDQDDIQLIREPSVIFSILWENFFRTIYAGFSAWCTLISTRKYFPEHHRFVLMQPSPTNFLYLLDTITTSDILNFENLKGVVIFKEAAIGLSSTSFIPEIEPERSWLWSHLIQSFCIRMLSIKLKSRLLGHKNGEETNSWARILNEVSKVNLLDHKGDIPGKIKSMDKIIHSNLRKNKNLIEMTVIVRKSGKRGVLNMQEILQALKKYPNVRISTYDFDDEPFHRQLEIIDSTDILVGVHGAALSHIAFLRPGSAVLEIFPFGFRKTIYQSLARMKGISYSFWQNSYKENTIFHWEYVEANRFTNTSKEVIQNNPIMWHNMDSKNYYRNQDTIVNIPELLHVLNHLVRTQSNRDRHESEKYLMYLPWEQLNNQVIGLKSACAVSKMLDRTLVLPFVGFPFNSSDTFQPHLNEWFPFNQFFDMVTLIEKLPCKFITAENFHSFYWNNEIKTMFFHNLDPVATTRQQMVDYLVTMYLQAPSHQIISVEPAFHLSKDRIMQLYGNSDKHTTLYVGSCFWFYNFGLNPVYPLDKFYDYLDESNSKIDQLYRQISEGIQPTRDIKNKARDLLSKLKSHGSKVLAIHVRRGDYYSKCRKEWITRLKEPNWKMFRACYLSDQDLALILNKKLEENPDLVIYISSNAPPSIADIAKYKAQSSAPEVTSFTDFSVETGDLSYDFSKLFDNLDKEHHYKIFFSTSFEFQFDSIYEEKKHKREMILIEQWMVVEAELFLGNIWSSFSRHIAEWRKLIAKNDEGTSWILL